MFLRWIVSISKSVKPNLLVYGRKESDLFLGLFMITFVIFSWLCKKFFLFFSRIVLQKAVILIWSFTSFKSFSDKRDLIMTGTTVTYFIWFHIIMAERRKSSLPTKVKKKLYVYYSLRGSLLVFWGLFKGLNLGFILKRRFEKVEELGFKEWYSCMAPCE